MEWFIISVDLNSVSLKAGPNKLYAKLRGACSAIRSERIGNDIYRRNISVARSTAIHASRRRSSSAVTCLRSTCLICAYMLVQGIVSHLPHIVLCCDGILCRSFRTRGPRTGNSSRPRAGREQHPASRNPSAFFFNNIFAGIDIHQC